MKWYEASLIVAAIFAGFALVHSLLVTGAAKSIARKLFGEERVRAYYRLGYTVVSSVAVLIAIYLISLVPDVSLYTPPLWLKLVCYALQAVGLAVGAVAFIHISFWEFAGFSQAMRRLGHTAQVGDDEGLRQSLVRGGIFGMVRHPLYLSGVMLFMFNPHYTRTWITVSVMAIGYFVLGAFLEERRLLDRIGDEYRRYMERVPRFVPKIFS